jgi:hypothetical protein
MSDNPTYQASGIEWLTLARFAVLILRPVNTVRWAHSAWGQGPIGMPFFPPQGNIRRGDTSEGDRKPFASTLKGEER